MHATRTIVVGHLPRQDGTLRKQTVLNYLSYAGCQSSASLCSSAAELSNASTLTQSQTSQTPARKLHVMLDAVFPKSQKAAPSRVRKSKNAAASLQTTCHRLFRTTLLAVIALTSQKAA